MARRIRVTSPYLSDAWQLGVRPGTDPARDVARVVLALEKADDLPGPGDRFAFVPASPAGGSTVQKLAHVRRVPGRNLWVWYWSTEDEVQLVALTDEPP